MFDFSIFPVIETERLLLRELRFADAHDVLVFRGDPEVQKYNAPVSWSLEDVYSLMERLQEEYDARKGVSWAVVRKNQSVRILERIGFQREGTRRKHSWEEDGTFHDSALYELLREEYLLV